jgi:hypothetical protein
MDPDEALALARHFAKAAAECSEDDLEGAHDQLAIAVGHYQALDDWLSKGGFRPVAWLAVT